MADASKTSASLLGSIASWSRSATPAPPSPSQKPTEEIPGLKPSTGLDHTITHRPSPSLRKYPRDCPPLKTRWFYAVDVAKRKPFAPEAAPDDKAKPPPVPKKLVPFSTSDSQAIEKAFQSLDKDDRHHIESSEPTNTKVPVNEDYLFDVHIEKRELQPAYWLGPVYEIRRGSWFYTDGMPCDENLSNQLEEGYLKLTPWRRLGLTTPRTTPRSSSQPRSRPPSQVIDGAPQSSGKDFASQDDNQPPFSNTYRLFGAHMNTTVTYQDGTAVAYLTMDDFLSRMSTTVYGKFVGYGGTKVVRGWTETKIADPKPVEVKSDGKAAEAASTKEKRRSAKVSPERLGEAGGQDKTEQQPAKPRRTMLERQISSLAGMPEAENAEDLAEETAREEAKEMEDAREKDGEDQARQIDHLVLVTHGIGQRLGLRLDSINFVHDVNTLRKTMKAVYATAPDLQALSGDAKNCRVQVLPVCWRHLLDFPKQSLKQNRKEYDLGDADDGFDEEYPSLQDITVEGVPAVRNLITDLAMDVLLYQSAYREHIATIVQKECNRVHQLFKERTGFSGKVTFCGHSLGSAILFDILCRQEESTARTRPRRVSSRTSRDNKVVEQKDLRLDFDVEHFFCLGSPIAMFQMLKGRTIAGRQALGAGTFGSAAVPMSPFDSDHMKNDPFESLMPPGAANTGGLIPITTSSPKCNELYNVFHPTDPIAYRMEPLISPAMAQLRSQALPYTKKGLFAAPGISNISARFGQQVMSSWYNLTSGVASSLINRSLGITGEEQALVQDKGKSLVGAPGNPAGPNVPLAMPVADGKRQQDLADAAKSSSEQPPTLIDSEIETLFAGFQKRRRSQSRGSTEDPAERTSAEFQTSQERERKLKREEAKVRALNSNGRVDYHIQEGMFDVSLLASIASHLSYWADEDVNHFMVGQMLKSRGRSRQVDS
ncbi:phospholipase A1 [Exophiala viscosa]|uniref:Phospholipase A1 n=1 Tax=Exophiala viscosa TaxID=2486360 RepID=A0AAN6I9S1_9EURO|nr:phospholipase A1 [Exophiala viscosa]KAI1625049.1 phospholipase A1 [Exophiala viscosa]